MRHEQLVLTMIEQCRDTIAEHDGAGADQPPSLRPKHLLTMCNRLIDHIEDWPPEKLHRWIGFVQCAMIANRMIDLEGAKVMFDYAKRAFGDKSADMVDHLDVDSDFRFDIGGEG